MGRSWESSGQKFPWVEPAINSPVYCTGLAHAFPDHDLIHLVFYVEQVGPHGVEHVGHVRLIMPQKAIVPGRALVDFALCMGNRELLNA